MASRILHDYLAEIARVRATRAGTGEISFYGALTGALNAAGERLRPRVFAISNLRNRGAGFPDMGLFTAAKGRGLDEWPEGVPPDRGVVEVDDIPAELSVKLSSAQVARYLEAYGLVLVTNFREFVLLGRDPAGKAERRERFSFDCPDAGAFFDLARAAKTPDGLAARFAEFLERVLLHEAPLGRPEEVAFFLASYARDALARVNEHASLPALADLRAALEEALGLTFDGLAGERLFRGTLVQTLFYGLFSAWVESANAGEARFDWHGAGWNLHVPFVDTLFERIAAPSQLRPLGLEEPMAWAAAALNRIDQGAFFARFEEADAVRYFYEPFLAAFDPELRRQLGVWYTPREIVRYMVERVDRVLRSELGVADGLADPSVWVLDPCCGTGAYLVEVLALIERTLRAKSDDALVAEDLKQAAMTRVAGFEIMPAPYVIAHWQVARMLRAAGAPLGKDAQGRDERAAVYLTNALTGWAASDAPADPAAAQRGIRLTYPPLADERDKAARVKQVERILVVLGNPPYNAFAGTSPAEESGLVTPYKAGLQRDWGIRKFNLDDLYVRFFRIAERRIAEGTGRGVVCFISNHSWLWYPSYVVMRQRMLAEFDRIWIDELHGDRKSSERGPDGRTSQTIFAMRGFSPGIRQGVAISTLVRKSIREEAPLVLFGDSANASDAEPRRQQLIESLNDADFELRYTTCHPSHSGKFSFRPGDFAADYKAWPTLPELSALPPFSGVLEKRHGSLMSMDRTALQKRMERYCDPKVEFADVKAEGIGPIEDMAGFNAAKARSRLLLQEPFASSSLRLITLYPFEQRWVYYTDAGPIWNRSRPDLAKRAFEGNGFVITRFRSRRPDEGHPIFWTPLLPGDHLLDPNAHPLPVLAAPFEANLSAPARAWLATLDLPDPDADRDVAALPWRHALAIGYAPAWLAENADGIRQEWPRVPLPGDAVLLSASAALGAQVAALLDPDADVPGVTSGDIHAALASIASPAMRGGGAMGTAHRALTAGWGHVGKGGAVMPGRGCVVTRAYSAAEVPAEAEAVLLGQATCDVFLNNEAFWRNIPEAVWSFTIGGYQVLKKWLSYREQRLIGRPLSSSEVRYLRDVARRLAALRLMGPALDANYRACAAVHRPLDAVASTPRSECDRR